MVLGTLQRSRLRNTVIRLHVLKIERIREGLDTRLIGRRSLKGSDFEKEPRSLLDIKPEDVKLQNKYPKRKMLCKLHRVELKFLSKIAKAYICGSCVKDGYYNARITKEWKARNE